MKKKAAIIGGVASALVLGGTGLAVALTGTPPSRDDVYISTLDERGIPIVSREKALDAAVIVCDAIKTGLPAWMIAQTLDEESDALDARQALAYTSITQDAYCPGATR